MLLISSWSSNRAQEHKFLFPFQRGKARADHNANMRDVSNL